MNPALSPSAHAPSAVSPASVAPGRPPLRRLGPIQAASGAVFAAFLCLHLLTASSGLLGVAGYDATLALLRRIYRPHIVVEIVLIGGSAAVHIACAVAQMRRRGRVFSLSGPLWMRAHRLSGYFLLLVLFGHVFATRIAPTLAVAPTATGRADFAFLAYAALSAPAFFWPYYLLLALAGGTHLGLGLHLASRILRRPKTEAHTGQDGPRAPQGAPSRLRLAVILTLTAVATAGVFSILWHASDAPRERFPEYKALADRLLP